MGTVRNRMARCAKCVSERNFRCRNVRVYRGGPGARADFRRTQSNLVAHRRDRRAITANGKHARWNGRTRVWSRF